MYLDVETVDILRRLFNKHRIGHKHTEEKNCLRRLKILPPKKRKQVYEEWRYLVNCGWVIRLKKTGEFHVSLNPRFMGEIIRMIENERR